MPKFSATLNLPKYATAPTSPTPVNGDVYYNTTDNAVYSRINGAWVDLAATGAVVSSTSTKTANYVLLTSDANVFIRMNLAAANTVTVGTTLNTLADGSMIHIQQIGAGKTTVVASGVTITSTPTLGLRAQYSAATLIKVGGTGNNVWTLVGDLSA